MSSSSDTPKLLVLGGGVCGLYGALEAQKIGVEVSLFEKESKLGGLASGHKLGENWYDLGVHMLHAFDQDVFETCKEAMAEERIEVPLKANIKWMGKEYRYPLRGRDILLGLPPVKLFRCVAGLLIAELTSPPKLAPEDEDAETALIDMYGAPLYEFFFEEFTHRYWGIHPSKLSAEFVRRKMPRLSAVDVFKNLVGFLKIAKPKDAVEGALRFETLHYATTGCEALPRKLGEKVISQGGVVTSDTAVEVIYHKEGKIDSIEAQDQKFGSSNDVFLSTMPITELVQKFSPAAPIEVLEAAKYLRYKPMVVYALLVKKEQCMEALYTYYRDYIFHRVGEPKNAGLEVKPAGHTTLIVEMTCEEGDAKWNDQRFDGVVRDLEKEGLCKREDIVEKHLISSRYAYPIFNKGFDQHLKVIQDYLTTFSNLRSVGRQGAFTYPNMHSAMRMGAKGVKELLEGLDGSG